MATNESIKLSAPQSTKALELAQHIWRKMNRDKPSKHISDPPFKYEVKKRIPGVEKAKRAIRFNVKTLLEDGLIEIIPWVEKQIEMGGI